MQRCPRAGGVQWDYESPVNSGKVGENRGRQYLTPDGRFLSRHVGSRGTGMGCAENLIKCVMNTGNFRLLRQGD